jgi:hypothetical protein
MKLSNWLVGGVVLGAFAAAVPAQRMQLGDGSGREVVVLDVGDLIGPAALPRAAGAPGGVLGVQRHAKAEPIEPGDLARLASLARLAATAANAKGDVQPLGERHLAAMGDAQWIGCVEGFLRDAKANAAEQFLLDIKVLEMSEGAFVEFGPAAKLITTAPGKGQETGGDDPAPTMLVLEGDAADALVKRAIDASANVLQAPQIVAKNLQAASMAVAEQIAYVRDFTVRTENGTVIAEPVVDTVEAGTRIETLCAVDKDGKILVDLAFQNQVVDQPLAEWKTKLGVKGQELTVQVPRVSGCKASMKLLMAAGRTALVPAKRSDGKWLLVMARVYRVRDSIPMGAGRGGNLPGEPKVR